MGFKQTKTHKNGKASYHQIGQACADLGNAARPPAPPGQLQDRTLALPGLAGSPAPCWSHFFLCPPLPSSIAGHAIPDVHEPSLELLAERFKAVFDACKKYSLT